MANGFDTIHAKSAVKDHNKFDLSFTHLTTMDFGEIVPLMSQECIPGDKFNVKGNFFSRMAPLVKPTYGKFSFKTMATFVPYFQVADDVEAWLAGQTMWLGRSTNMRAFTLAVFAKWLDSLDYVNLNDITEAAAVLTEMGYDASDYNYVTIDGSGGTATYTNSADTTVPPVVIEFDWWYRKQNQSYCAAKFGPKAKYYVKIMNALGYAIPQNVSLVTGSTWYTVAINKKLNAMPLLCFAKAYNDWMSQSTRYNTAGLTTFLQSVKEDKDVQGYYSSSHLLDDRGISLILNAIKVQYENDYFVSAWMNANAPLQTSDSLANITAPRASGTTSDVTIYNNQSNVMYTGSTISQRALDFLKSFDDWVRRNNYSGSREVQQIYSRFGIKTENFRSNYAHVISTNSSPIQVGDVTATAEAGGIQLGDYAGKGIMSGDHGFSFTASDYGMLFVFGWYSVRPMNAYGMDRTVLKNTPLDFYNPDFDGLGANAISAGELFSTPFTTLTDGSSDSDVYGFTERYNEYRYGRDKITGDFRDFHPAGDMNTWHTGRLLNDVRRQGYMVAQGDNMNSMPQTNSEFNRIFSITDDKEDHFYMTAQFSVSAVRPMLSINQVPRLGEGNTIIPRNGNVIN